jgi:hypothetical protein
MFCLSHLAGILANLRYFIEKFGFFKEKPSKVTLLGKKESSSLQETSPRNFFEASFSSERQSFQVQDYFTLFLKTLFYPRIVHFEKIYPV